MNRDYFKWVAMLAMASVILVPFFMWHEQLTKAPAVPKQVVSHPFSPFSSYISAVGVVEASGGNISIGSAVDRIVKEIDVKVGEKVKKQDVLFRLESDDLEAELVSRNIDYEDAEANLKRLKALPREEDVAIALAQLEIAKIGMEQAKSLYERVKGLQNGAVSQEEISRRRFVYEESQAKYEQAKADTNKTKAGTWPPDLDIAELQVKKSKALVDRIKADIERTVIRAPMDATVLQIKIHEGEFPPVNYSQDPAMIIGDTKQMSLRVSINQFDASYYDSSSPAVAFLQGNGDIGFPLQFMYLEPYFVPKNSLSNDIREQVDTRVLQAVYSFEAGDAQLFVGQQMDVFIETLFIP